MTIADAGPRADEGPRVPWDTVARTAARLLKAPMAVIGTGDRLLGTYGLPAGFTVGPATDVAAELGVRSSAGVPLWNERQQVVGAITVLDTVARIWPDTEMAALTEVAAMFGGGEPAGKETSALAGLAALGGGATVLPAAQVNAQRGFISALLDSLQIGVVAVDADGRPVLLNRTLRRFAGVGEDVSLAEAMTEAQHRLWHLDGKPYQAGDMAVARALAGHGVRDLEAVLRIPGEPDRYTLTNGEPIRGADGELLGAVATVSDVTDRRRRERFHECELTVTRLLAGAESVEQAAPPLLEALGRALGWPHVALFLVDEVADVLRTAAYWSAPGVDVDDLVPERIPPGDAGPGLVWATGQSLWIPDLTAPRFTETPQARAFAHAAAGRGLRASLTVPVRDGDRVLGILATLSATSEYDGFLLTDLVEGIAGQLSQFLTGRRSRELTMQLNRARDDFLTLAGHELRTPLTSIISYTTLLADETDDPDRRQMVDAIRRNVGNLQQIIDDLLELTALESGHRPIRPVPTDLSALVTDAVAGFELPAGLRIHTCLPATLMLDADPDRLRQIVDQLVSNAVKYSPGGGDVHITADDPDPDVVEFAVADSGIGIPADDRGQLFDRFHRAGNARHTAIPGTGLGLPLARSLVVAHGGTITLDPAHRPGTRIVVRLPRHQQERGSRAA